MKAVDGDIISQEDWFTTQNMLFTYSEEEQEENKIAKNNADLLARDGVHFTSYKPLCEEIQKHIMKHM